jgi:threonylcarbamoyladenosine tRNA methylthiotransferase MtaB
MNQNGTSRRKAAIFTIGCRLNQAETALIQDKLEQIDFEILPESTKETLDVVIINSCTVTGAAAKKSHQAARRLRRKHPNACIIATGCSTEIPNDNWEEESAIDFIVTNQNKSHIVEKIIESLKIEHSLPIIPPVDADHIFHEKANGVYPFRSRAFLKIQEGCNSFCSYCIVPYARGRERSRNWDEIIENFNVFLKQGFKEIILTGVNIATYNDSGRTLFDLINTLVDTEGEFRIRLSSTEPHPENIKLIDIMKRTNKLCRFLHFPLQHGSETILKAMNRHYSLNDYKAVIDKARELIPNVHIGTDVIVGFPGETDEHFQEMVEFVKGINYANMHIFSYSIREGTVAATLPNHIPADIIKERYTTLNNLAQKMKQEYAKQQIGEELQLLVEKIGNEEIGIGWSDNYQRIHTTHSSIQTNKLYTVKIDKLNDKSELIGTLIN